MDEKVDKIDIIIIYPPPSLGRWMNLQKQNRFDKSTFADIYLSKSESFDFTLTWRQNSLRNLRHILHQLKLFNGWKKGLS